MGDFPESLTQAMLVGTSLVGRLGVDSLIPSPRPGAMTSGEKGIITNTIIVMPFLLLSLLLLLLFSLL